LIISVFSIWILNAGIWRISQNYWQTFLSLRFISHTLADGSAFEGAYILSLWNKILGHLIETLSLDPSRYQILIGMLNCLTNQTKHLFGCQWGKPLAQFLKSPQVTIQIKLSKEYSIITKAIRILLSIPLQSGVDLLIIGYIHLRISCSLCEGNPISRKSKKQNVVVKSSVEAEYLAMNLTTYGTHGCNDS
jgi:hypothetical protein